MVGGFYTGGVGGGLLPERGHLDASARGELMRDNERHGTGGYVYLSSSSAMSLVMTALPPTCFGWMLRWD